MFCYFKTVSMLNNYNYWGIWFEALKHLPAKIF